MHVVNTLIHVQAVLHIYLISIIDHNLKHMHPKVYMCLQYACIILCVRMYVQLRMPYNDIAWYT